MKKYRLIYGNRRPAMLGEVSAWVKAASAQETVVKVLGGCKTCDGYNYTAGEKMFGTIETKP